VTDVVPAAVTPLDEPVTMPCGCDEPVPVV
jgi:hypothetical protein